MGRYVPKTYNNRRWLRVIIRSVAAILITVLVLFIALFFGLREYFLPGEDGSQRLEIPWLMDEQVSPD